MKAKVLKDAVVLVPNSEHQNFTYSDETIEEGEIINGKIRLIDGKRKGDPFTYRLFITNDGKILFLNKVQPMETTEVTLGADGDVTPTEINLRTGEKAVKNNLTGLVVGGLAGFAYSKYKKHDLKKTFMFSALGMAVGYGAAYFMDRSKEKIFVKASK